MTKNIQDKQNKQNEQKQSKIKQDLQLDIKTWKNESNGTFNYKKITPVIKDLKTVAVFLYSERT